MSVGPIQEERFSLRRTIQRLGGSIVVIGAAAFKWAFLFGKFFAFFASFALYSYLFHSWEFGLGFVLLILVHEMGHFLEAKRQGLHVTAPQFVPFFGAYVKIRQAHLAPWNNALVSLAGPFLGSVGAAVCWAISPYGNTQLWLGLANIGFLLNAFNLLPIGFLDGGSVARAIRESRHGWIRYENGVPVQGVGPDSRMAWRITLVYVALAAAIILGMLATKANGATL